MRELGLRGARQGRAYKRTTVADEKAHRPAALVERRFEARAPNQLWVADLTNVKTDAGWVCVAFVIDVFSRCVVGWQTSKSLRSDLALDALEMASYGRKDAGLAGLILHSDRGVQIPRHPLHGASGRGRSCRPGRQLRCILRQCSGRGLQRAL